MKKFTEQQRIEIRNCLNELSNSYTRIEAERDHIKNIIDDMAEKFEINKRLARRLSKIFHKRNIAEEIANSEELTETYDEVVGLGTSLPA